MNGLLSSGLRILFGAGLTVCLGLVVSSAGAQESEPGSGPPATSTVKIFEVTPVRRVPAILAPNAQTPAAPAPLDSQLKARILDDLGAEKDVPAGNEDHQSGQDEAGRIVLSSKQPFMEGLAVLTLNHPTTVHPETGIRFSADGDGSAAVKFMLQEGSGYLLDFQVRSSGPGFYTVETAGGAQQFDDQTGAREHILVAIKAQGSGWTTTRLKHQGSDFHLYSVELTEVK